MILARFENGQLVTTYADDENRELINQMVADGFKIFVEESESATTDASGVPLGVTLGEFQSLKRCYREEAHKVVASYEVVDNDPALITAEIARLKASLAATDYQVIKAYEYTLAGVELPDDLASLHTSRQTLRNRINALEQKLTGQ